jgi:cardiolipin synthase
MVAGDLTTRSSGMDSATDTPPAFAGPPDSAEYRRVLEAFTGIPATDGNRVTVLRNGDEIFPAMLESIARAERTIDLMTYIYWRGDISRRIAEALAERARAGVRVRMILDAFGTRPMEHRLIEHLRAAGVAVQRFRPMSGWKVWKWNMRTHRRVLVCDDEVAFTGGVGIAEEWEGDARGPDSWRDTHFKMEGAAVDGIHAAFYSDWLEADRPALTGTDRFPTRNAVGATTVQVIRAASQPGWNDVAVAVVGLVALARERIRVTSAYLRPPSYFIDLLCAAVERGVAVDVLVPGPHAEPAFYRWAAEYHYQELLDRGVRVWLYQPTMHHGKLVTVDGLVSLVGTTNFDARSLAVNEQIGLVLHDADVTATLDAHFEEDRARSELLDASPWRQRGWQQRARETAAHVATFGIRGGGASRRDSLFDASAPSGGRAGSR